MIYFFLYNNFLRVKVVMIVKLMCSSPICIDVQCSAVKSSALQCDTPQ